ncbi:MAG: DNA topoisomerase I [Candidatus Aenigmatarchaeota archaeon]
MTATIIIAEKPDAAAHIAEALAEGRAKKHAGEVGADYWEFMRNGKQHIVVAAVGHLFNLKQAGKAGWSYPVFEVEWAPSWKIRKKSEFSGKYFRTIEQFKGKAKDFIIACDYDNEGSVIGYNILRYIFEENEAKRMKFSTLTKQDLQKAYDEADKTLDWQNIECGLARHILDFYYGINSSRALTLAIKKSSSRFALLSAGRVQGPVLCMLSEREKEIKAFKPTPFWQLQANLLLDGKELLAEHETDKFWDRAKAEAALKNSKGKAMVESIEKKEYRQSPPVPFNITSLQTEAYRLFGYSPQQTLNIAQDLYTKAFISYPRTSSEKFPPQIGFRDILQAIAKIKKYSNLAGKLLALKELIPSEGKRTDPAHEAIHPTVEPPSDVMKLTGQQRNIYDLVVRRFFACFGEAAVRESAKIGMNIGDQPYSITGRRTLKPGWIEFYGPLAKFEEITLPDLKKGDKVDVKKVEMLDKETQPPARWSQAAMIKEMEKRNLGTRATRAAILQTLYDRYYVTDKSVRVTDLGMAVAQTLKKYVPDLVDEQLTKQFEIDLEKILQGKVKKEKVLEEAKKALIKISEEFKANEDKIGKELGKAVVSSQDDRNTLGPCKNCGGKLKVLFSPWTKKHFVGCSSYSRCKLCGFTKTACKCECPICKQPKGKCEHPWKEKVWNPSCQTGYPLPHNASFQRLDKTCEKCSTPMIRVIRKGKRPFNMCLDPKCETKADWGKPKEMKAKKARAKLKELKGDTKLTNKQKIKEIVKKRAKK